MPPISAEMIVDSALPLELIQTSATTTTNNVKQNKWLGSEPSLFGREVEIEKVEKMLQDLTDEEKEQFDDETMPIRYLRDQKCDVKKALKALRTTLKWRKENNVVDIVNCIKQENETQKELYQHMKTVCAGRLGYTRGYDKDGRAIHVADPTSDKTVDTEENLLKYITFSFEKAIACTKRRSNEIKGKSLEQIVFVSDYKNFKLSDAGTTSFNKGFFDLIQNHYPERLHKAYLLNTPFVFRFFWATIRSFMNARTRSRVVFLSDKDIDKFLETIVETDKLEPSYGGPIEDPVRKFDDEEYMNLPLDVGFDE